MNTSDIIKLIDAGFTKADIEAMLKNDGQIKAEEPEIREEPKIEELTAEKPKAEEPADNQLNDAIKMMTDELKAMRSDFQKHMINNDEMQISDPLAESEKILASIIDPPTKKRKER